MRMKPFGLRRLLLITPLTCSWMSGVEEIHVITLCHRGTIYGVLLHQWYSLALSLKRRIPWMFVARKGDAMMRMMINALLIAKTLFIVMTMLTLAHVHHGMLFIHLDCFCSVDCWILFMALNCLISMSIIVTVLFVSAVCVCVSVSVHAYVCADILYVHKRSVFRAIEAMQYLRSLS